MGARPVNDGQPWTREQLVLAFDLYCRIPFRRTKASDIRVKELAALIGRTPASVARKLGNLGAFDPHLAACHISGLAHGSKLDKAVWDEFHRDWAGLVVRAHEIRTNLKPDEPSEQTLVVPQGPSERAATVKQRLHQSFFRDAILSSYNATCCITGLPILQCLVASHIIPWSKNEQLRCDPTNGLCLSASFDRLFDCGMISITDDLRVQVADNLLRSANPVVRAVVCYHQDQAIIRPSRFLPNPEYLGWHRHEVFGRRSQQIVCKAELSL